MSDLRFDPTVSLGTVLHALVMIATIVAGYMRISDRLTRLETKMNVVWRWWARSMKANGGNDQEFPP